LAVFMGKNIVHGSDSPAGAEREVNLFFDEDEMCAYLMPAEECLYE